MITHYGCTQRALFYGSLCALALNLTGCVNYTGIHSKQHTKNSEQFATKHSLAGKNGLWPSRAWAKTLDPQLPVLINEGLAHNPDLHVAVARQSQAQALVEGRNAALAPHVDFYGLVGRNKAILPFAHLLQNFGVLALNFNYELDFWGKNYSLLAQALSEEKVAQAALYQSALMLSTLIASTYNELAYDYDLRAVLLHTEQQRVKLNKITKQLFNSGLSTQVQVDQAENAYADVKVRLVAVDGQIQVTRQQLGILLGAGPDRGFTIPKPRFILSKQPKLPNNLPLNLLGRRPDIVAARWQVEAALYGVKNVKAQFYPNVDLMAIAAKVSLGNLSFFGSSNELLAGAAAITLPIFDGNVLRSQLKGQYGALDEKIAIYNATLNKALGEVAEQMTLIRSIDQQLKVQEHALHVAKQAFVLAEKQYQIGLTSQVVMLSAETQYLNEQQAKLLLIRSRRDVQIALIKALGGGFDEAFLPTSRTIASPNHLLKKDIHV